MPSGLTALLIAMVPVWIALFVAASTRIRPTRRVLAGLALGIVGVALIGGPAILEGGSAAGIAIVLVASIAWSAGSLYARRAPLPRDVLLGASLEMIAGGVLLAFIGLGSGEATRVDLARVTLRTLAAGALIVAAVAIVVTAPARPAVAGAASVS